MFVSVREPKAGKGKGRFTAAPFNPCPGVLQAEDGSGVTKKLYVRGRKESSLLRQMPINPTNVAANWLAIRTIAPDRFDKFKRHGDVDELDAVARYIWNLDLC